MTNAQHLIENIIVGMESHIEINSDINTKYTNCTLDEAKEMAEHIVYSLYDGLLPKDVEKMKDRVEVVRCKECKHYIPCREVELINKFCDLQRNHFCPDDFCSYGERKVE